MAVDDGTLEALVRESERLARDGRLADPTDSGLVTAVLEAGDAVGLQNTYGEEVAYEDLRPQDVGDIIRATPGRERRTDEADHLR